MSNTNCSDIGLACDVCGRTVQGITFMNGMKFCARCYQETFNNNRTRDYIDMLDEENYKMQIEFLKSQVEKYKDAVKKNNVGIVHLKNQLKQAKQQLAEKNKEIKRLNTQFDLYRSTNIQKGFNNPDVIKALRHKVCEELKKELTEPADRLGFNYAEYMYDLEDLIDRIDWIEGARQ